MVVLKQAWSRAHPRVGGEHSRAKVTRALEAGSSPRWRGAHCDLRGHFMASGLIPALAGSTSPVSLFDEHVRAHPRVGGEHRVYASNSLPAQGSSPRWRGALFGQDPAGSVGGLIPALAGST